MAAPDAEQRFPPFLVDGQLKTSEGSPGGSAKYLAQEKYIQAIHCDKKWGEGVCGGVGKGCFFFF